MSLEGSGLARGATFKYGLLRHYPPAFAGRAGAWSAGRRVVFLDGYAGTGQYPDGAPGTAARVVAAMAAGDGAEVTGVFVERDRDVFASIHRALTGVDTGTVDYRLFAGALSDHLPGILRLVPDSALFALLNPVETVLGREEFTGGLLARGLAPTEAAVVFDVPTLARIGSGCDDEAAGRLDRFLGGEWWRRDARTVGGPDDLSRASRMALRIAGRFAHHVERRTGYRVVAMPVRLRPGHLPHAVLVHVARGLDGTWQFVDTVGRAGLDCYEALRADEYVARREREREVGQLALFTIDSDPAVATLDSHRQRHDTQWIAAIERNIVRVLVDHGPFALADRVVEVYGDTLGLAGDPHVRGAVRNLHDDGLLADDGQDDRFHARELRLTAAARPTQPALRLA